MAEKKKKKLPRRCFVIYDGRVWRKDGNILKNPIPEVCITREAFQKYAEGIKRERGKTGG